MYGAKNLPFAIREIVNENAAIYKVFVEIRTGNHCKYKNYCVMLNFIFFEIPKNNRNKPEKKTLKQFSN